MLRRATVFCNKSADSRSSWLDANNGALYRDKYRRIGFRMRDKPCSVFLNVVPAFLAFTEHSQRVRIFAIHVAFDQLRFFKEGRRKAESARVQRCSERTRPEGSRYYGAMPGSSCRGSPARVRQAARLNGASLLELNCGHA